MHRQILATRAQRRERRPSPLTQIPPLTAIGLAPVRQLTHIEPNTMHTRPIPPPHNDTPPARKKKRTKKKKRSAKKSPKQKRAKLLHIR
jgi:hypothetical protein